MGPFGLKMACRHNSGSTLRIFLKFCTMKGAKRYMKISLMVFPKKISFWARKWCDFITLDPLGDFFLIKHNKRGQKVHGT